MSPLQKIARAHQNTPTDRMEVIRPYIIAPWENRLTTTLDFSTEKAVHVTAHGVRIATSSSAKKEIVGISGAIHDTLGIKEPSAFSVTLKAKTEQNSYTAELAAIAMAMKQLLPDLIGKQIAIFSSN